MPHLEVHYGDEWSALYVDGVLDPDTVGSRDAATDRALQLAGVIEVEDSPFELGQYDKTKVAQTLEQVAEFRRIRGEHRRANALAKAADLRKQAAELERAAEEESR